MLISKITGVTAIPMISNNFNKLLEEWDRFLESGLLKRKGDRFFLSDPKGMELSNQILISMFKWWDKIN